MNTTIMIPAAGEGSRFVAAGFTVPKPFLPLDGAPMLQHVIDNVRIPGARYVILARVEHLRHQKAAAEAIEAREDVTWVPVERLTEGTACTLLLAEGQVDPDAPLLVANSDQLVEGHGIQRMVDTAVQLEWDGAILVFDCDPDPKWSYARVDQGWVVEVAEKKPISRLATVGIYYFRRARDFYDAARAMIAANDRVNNEFYTCPVYNYMIARGSRVGVFEISQQAMAGLGTPEDFNRYLARRDRLSPPSGNAAD